MTDSVPDQRQSSHRASGGVMGGAYGLGFIGAVVYFIQHAHGFGEGVFGVLKAVVWPALLVYKLLGHLGM